MYEDRGEKVIIDAGHGGEDIGAVGNLDGKNILEKDYSLKLSIYQAHMLSSMGYETELTRKKDIFLTAEERTAAIRNSGADFCISNHFNSTEKGAASGSEIIHSIHQDGKLSHYIKHSLEGINREVNRIYCKSLNEDQSEEDFFFIHRESGEVRTVIMENAFIDNHLDMKRYLRIWKKIGRKVCESLQSFIRMQNDKD